MHRKIVLTAVLALFAIPLCADPVSNPWRVSVLAAPASGLRTGIGAAIAFSAVSAWDVELAAASQSYRSVFVHFEAFAGQFPVPSTQFRSYNVYPFDLVATRHFMTDRRLSPYVRGGVRYVEAPNSQDETFGYPLGPPSNVFLAVHSGFGLHDRTSAQAGAGLMFRLTPRVALRADLNRLIRSDRADFDPLTHSSFGVSWRF
jgi:hypothetical protein